MKKKWICLLLVALLLCGAVTACAPEGTDETSSGGTTSKIKVTIDYLMAVIPVDELLENDPTVFRGTYASIEKAIDLNSTTSAGYEKRMVHTYFNVDVTETFMGVEEKKKTIIQLGGETETQIVETRGIPQAKIGDEWFFFITESGNFPHHYSFPIQDGKVWVERTELPEVFEGIPEGTDFASHNKQIPVEEFEAILRAKIAARNSEK